ncbi:hypothetical protein COS61_02075 [Candidatus Wolfebacteria bacterium CG03_land_8_20_14_0_80_40_12]|uniref:EamA domain-containing protein n=1 Tax=Candidatus Wolfebacteria bacterium CG03_land_8_20_14_0_80_40_12 TaxID=1975069 RepID=A0A2M7B5B4_9BACT|nr:MAG: hypothetical protein COS61_02075 [Candidatus Wolfebacteria bacterium CG03_land_8_20_14_0_80_40_12]
MNWLTISVLAQVILGTSAVFDKILLGRKFFNPFVYAFWLGVLGVFSAVLLPFGFQAVSFQLIGVAFLAGAFFILAIFFLFYALDLSEASQTLPVIGGISPLFTLIFSYFLLGSWLGSGDLAAFLIIISGALILFAVEKKEIRKSALFLILLSSLFFGASNVLSKIVFEAGNFVSGFFWIKIGGVLSALLFLVFKKYRRQILDSSRRNLTSHYFLYLANRIYAGIGSALVGLAIFLSYQPALVDAVQSFKYVIIFLAALVLLKERFYGKILVGKLLATIFISFGIFLIAVIGYARAIPIDKSRPIVWGLTYSTKFAGQLGLNWQEAYGKILAELKPKKVRLVAYWDEIEKERGSFDFSKTDWLLQKTKEGGAPVILAIGLKAPRWPEFHAPDWARSMSVEDRENALREYLKKVIERYKNESLIESWQIENEPFLRFGERLKRGEDFLEREISAVKSIDDKKPVLITDSGEFGLWYKAAKKGDVFGTTMYRKVHAKALGWLFGNIEYPIGPEHFRLKEKIIRFLINDFTKKFIVIELQAEPWSKIALEKITYDEQIKLFSLDYFADTIRYAKETGFDEYYFWGAEWWYFIKEKYQDSRYWNFAKTIFNQ